MYIEIDMTCTLRQLAQNNVFRFKIKAVMMREAAACGHAKGR
jgi:hypothetical protein